MLKNGVGATALCPTAGAGSEFHFLNIPTKTLKWARQRISVPAASPANLQLEPTPSVATESHIRYRWS